MGFQRPVLFAGLGMMIGAASVAFATVFLPADAAPTISQAALTPPTTETAAAVVTGPRSAPRAMTTPHSTVQLASTGPMGALAALPPSKETLTVRRGDTLMGLLVDAGVDRAEAHDSIEAMRAVYDPRNLRPGDEVTLTFATAVDDPSDRRFQGFSLAPDPARTIAALRDDDTGGFQAQERMADLTQETQRVDGRIDSSLFEAATTSGVPPRVLAAMIKTLSYDVDFQRDIRQGDGFSVMYSRSVTDDGVAVGEPEVLYLSMDLSGQHYAYYRYEDGDGFVDYYNAQGHSVRKALLRTPINGARLSSGFGMRKHPVLGYSRMHKGIDFAARTGTPIFAAGDGVVERANRFGSYGNYVRIRHNSDWATAYAHMSRFAKGMHAGKRVHQGDVIGYVGTTGRSTGAHLHYEILKKNAQVNPMKVRFPSGRTLKGKELARFASARQKTEALYASLPHSTTLAQAE